MKNRILQIFPPKRTIFTALTVLAIVTILLRNELTGGIHILVALLTVCIVEWLLRFFFHRPLGLPDAGLISAFIFSFVISPDAPWWLLIAGIIVAMLIKAFLRTRGVPLFNPAATAIVLSGLLGVPLAWWGERILLLTLVLGLIVVGRIKKYPQVGAFAVSYIIIQFIVFLVQKISVGEAGTEIFRSFPVFFTLFMMPEPQSSPGQLERSVLFGASAALFGFLLSFTAVSAVALPLGLLSANLTRILYTQQLRFPWIGKTNNERDHAERENRNI